jgi:hypothetical protein
MVFVMYNSILLPLFEKRYSYFISLGKILHFNSTAK